jgi:hypothetical protein
MITYVYLYSIMMSSSNESLQEPQITHNGHNDEYDDSGNPKNPNYHLTTDIVSLVCDTTSWTSYQALKTDWYLRDDNQHDRKIGMLIVLLGLFIIPLIVFITFVCSYHEDHYDSTLTLLMMCLCMVNSIVWMYIMFHIGLYKGMRSNLKYNLVKQSVA